MAEQQPAGAAAHHVAVHPFVRGLEPADVDRLQHLAATAEFASGEYLFEAGGEADMFYLVRTGVVALELPETSDGTTTIQTLQEGSALGWSWLHAPQKWQFSAKARTPVRALVFESASLLEWFASDPAAGYRVVLRLAELMADRLHATRHTLIQLSRGH